MAALLPPGVMPGRAPDGVISLVLCTSDGLHTLYLDAKGRQVEDPATPAPEDDRQTKKSICLFGSGLTADLTSGVPTLGHPGPIRLPAARAFAELLLARAQHLPLGARAPPFPLHA